LTYGNGRYVKDPSLTPGVGGQGSVIFCDDKHLDRKVAIKFLSPGSEKKRIFDEVAALQKVRSKYVVEMFDIVPEGPANHIGIVQEYLPGVDLTGFPKQNPAPTAHDFLLVSYQLALGLENVHEQGQIHRDIKPHNLRYDAERILKIHDFGLSRPDDGRTNNTVGYVGTPGYTAPELHIGGHVTFTTAIDVYAFGATALYLARGKLPAELLENPPRGEDWARRGFATLPFTLPPAVCALLNRCLANAPTARPAMTEVRQCIEHHLVQGRHRALLVAGTQTYVCDGTNPAIRLNNQRGDEMGVFYDGMSFAINDVVGNCYVNNSPVVVGARIPGSCVVTIGTGHRLFVTVDVSHPEVVS